MTTDYDFFDYELLSQGADAYLDTSSTTTSYNREASKVRYAPGGEEITFQFATSPVTMNEDHGWLKFREARCTRIIVPGVWSPGSNWAPRKPGETRTRAELPYRMRSVPVYDRGRVVDADGNIKIGPVDDIADINGVSMDVRRSILDPSSQKFKTEGGWLNVEWSWMVNIVVHSWPVSYKEDGTAWDNPQVGDLVVLNLSKVAGDELFNSLRAVLDIAPDFDPIRYIYSLKVHKGKVTPKITLKRGAIAPPLEGLEIVDLVELQRNRREEFLEYVRAAWADYNGVVAAPTMATAPATPLLNPADSAFVDAALPPETVSGMDMFVDMAIVSDTPTPVADDAAVTEQAAPLNPFELISSVKLKAQLLAAGVTVPPRTPRAKLIAMAQEHLK